MYRYRVALSLASVLLFMCFGADGCHSEDSWTIRDLVAGWNRVNSRYETVRAKIENTDFSRDDNFAEQRVAAKVQIKRRGNLLLFLYTDSGLMDLEPNDGVENPVMTERSRCNVVNDDYSFSLRRIGAEGSWVISQYGPPGADAFASVQRHLQQTSGGVLFGATSFGDGTSMVVISARKDFRVQSIRTADLEGAKVAVLEFTLTNKKLDNFLDLKRGRVFCDPNMDFAIRRTEMEVTFRTAPNEVHKGVRELTYDAEQNVQKMVTSSFNAKHGTTTRATAIIKDLEFTASPESDFRLTAFGLPEIRPPKGNSFSFIITGVCILSIAFATHFWLHRKRSTGAAIG